MRFEIWCCYKRVFRDKIKDSCYFLWIGTGYAERYQIIKIQDVTRIKVIISTIKINDNVYKVNKDLPNKSDKDIKPKYIKSNTNSLLPKVDYKELIYKDGPACNNNENNNNDKTIINNNVCESSIDNVSESIIDLPNISDKGIKANSRKSNINSLLLKIDSNEFIKYEDPAYNSNESNNSDKTIINNDVCESIINNVSTFNIDLPNKLDKGIKAKYIKLNINSPLPKVDSKDLISKDDTVCNNNESNNNNDKNNDS